MKRTKSNPRNTSRPVTSHRSYARVVRDFPTLPNNGIEEMEIVSPQTAIAADTAAPLAENLSTPNLTPTNINGGTANSNDQVNHNILNGLAQIFELLKNLNLQKILQTVNEFINKFNNADSAFAKLLAITEGLASAANIFSPNNGN